MIQQYIAFAVVVLIAIFVVTQFEWNSLPVLGINQIDSGLRIETAEQSAISDREVNFRDLSVGGVTGAPRRKNPETIFSPPETVTQTTVAMSSPLTATSTPFQTGQ
jgi:hypothetical protein